MIASLVAGTMAVVLAGCQSERILDPAPRFTIAPRNTLVQEGMLLLLRVYSAPDGPVVPPVSWTSTAPGTATVDANGTVSAVAPGDAMLIATAGGFSDTAVVTVQNINTASLVAFGDTNCGLTTTAGAVCWGENNYGQTGTRLASEIVFIPTPVQASVTWRSLAGSWNHVCGVDNQYDIYCWGLNNVGQLGMGTESAPVMPSSKAVGNNKFIQVAAGGGAWPPKRDEEFRSSQLTCGLTREGEVLCWGEGGGPLATFGSSLPVAVAAGIRFASISVGNGYVCGVASDRRGYCWGNNELGQLGRAQVAFDRGPRPLDGNLRFERISAGGVHACGITLDGSAYCWGVNSSGQLGASASGTCVIRLDSPPCYTKPIAVAGGLKFRSISAGRWGATEHYAAVPTYNSHTCGVTVNGDIVCWGWNSFGQVLRSSSPILPLTLRSFPGIKFKSVVAGEQHTCALLTEGQVYCWGAYVRGQQGISGGIPQNADYQRTATEFVFK